MFTVEYSINFGCHEFVSDETLGIFEKESEAMCFWANQINMAHPIDFDDADAEIDSWDIQEGDYEYGEFYGGQINLCERTPNNYGIFCMLILQEILKRSELRLTKCHLERMLLISKRSWR